MSERLTVEQIEVFRWDMLTNRHLKHAICEAALSGIQRPDLEAAARVCDAMCDEHRNAKRDFAVLVCGALSLAAIRIRAIATGSREPK